VPQFGDWDEGRVLADSAAAGSVAGSTWLGLALSGETPPASAWEQYDELAWYAAPRGSGVEATPEIATISVSGGFTRVRQGPWHVWFKSGSGPSHQHADVSAVYVRRDDDWLICDPGTGTYNGPLEVRNGFRTSNAHPVWHPAGVDQMDPHRAFRWLRTVHGYHAAPVQTDGAVVLFAWHDAFEIEAFQTRVARAVVITKGGVLVRDFIENLTTPGLWEITVPLPPGGDPAQLFGLSAAVITKGQPEPFLGWHSATYGEWQPSQWLRLAASASDLPAWGAGEPPKGLEFSVHWAPQKVTLELTKGNRTHRLEASGV
jgi:hypothetical protein